MKKGFLLLRIITCMFIVGCAREHLTPAHLAIIQKAQTDIEDHHRDKQAVVVLQQNLRENLTWQQEQIIRLIAANIELTKYIHVDILDDIPDEIKYIIQYHANSPDLQGYYVGAREHIHDTHKRFKHLGKDSMQDLKEKNLWTHDNAANPTRTHYNIVCPKGDEKCEALCKKNPPIYTGKTGRQA